MSAITAQETIEDHILMTHAYAESLGDLVALDDAEAIINERRGEVVDTSGNVTPDYSRNIRDSVTVLFMRESCKTPEDHASAAQALEATWRTMLKNLGLDPQK